MATQCNLAPLINEEFLVTGRWRWTTIRSHTRWNWFTNKKSIPNRCWSTGLFNVRWQRAICWFKCWLWSICYNLQSNKSWFMVIWWFRFKYCCNTGPKHITRPTNRIWRKSNTAQRQQVYTFIWKRKIMVIIHG